MEEFSQVDEEGLYSAEAVEVEEGREDEDGVGDGTVRTSEEGVSPMRIQVDEEFEEVRGPEEMLVASKTYGHEGGEWEEDVSFSRGSDVNGSQNMSPRVLEARDRLSSLGLNLDESVFLRKATKSRFVHRQQPMLVLEFRRSGETEFQEMRRDDIMQEARAIVPPLRPPARAAALDAARKSRERMKVSASSTSETLDEEEEQRLIREIAEANEARGRYQGTLQHRDIRVLDSTFAQSRDPGIFVRRHSILVNLDPIRALVLYNKTFIFIPDGADSILQPLMQRLRDSEQSLFSEISFATRSLECIFVTICQTLNDQVRKIEPEVHSTIDEVVKSSSGVTIERLRQVKSNLSKISAKVVGVQNAFEELLENDRDMALMNLEKVHQFPEHYSEEREEIWSLDHEDMEILLENYAQAVDGTFAQLEGLRSEIDSAISTVSLRLDSARNKLLGVDLLVTSVTSVAAIGALFAGLFGMNLDSGVEERNTWFWAVFAIVVGGVPVMVVIMFYVIYKAGLLIT